MRAIYKKELRSCFTNMTGAVAVAVMLLVFGLMFRYYNLYNGVLTFHYAVSNSALVFYIAVPVLTMRTFADEKRLKTDQLLFSAPVTLRSVVLGKYLALVTVFAVPVAVMSLYPLIMRALGEETLLWDYTCILAFFLMGCAYLSVGMFISSCTESAVIAAMLSVVFIFATQMLSSVFTMISASALTALLFLIILAAFAALIVYLMTKYAVLGIAAFAVLACVCAAAYFLRPDWFSGRTESVLRVLDFSTHFSDFAGGVFSVPNLLFFVTYMAAGVILTVQSLDRRRWS